MRTVPRGLSLIEVLVAMTIFSFGILGLLGMHARALTNFSDAKYRTDAALLADSLVNDIWVNRANIANYAYSGSGGSTQLQPWLSEVKSVLPNSNATVAVSGTNVVVTLTWQPPNAAAAGQTHQHVEISTIQNP
jgi:type IV pilus assembly protein PilV